MASERRISRRDAISLGLVGGAAVFLPLQRTAQSSLLADELRESSLPAPYTVGFSVPPVLAPVKQTATTDFYELVQRQATAEILPGRQTTIWGYNGISPGPTIKARRGRDIVVRQINALPAKHHQLGYRPTTSTHLHGSHSLPQYDGYASDITDLQQYKDYVYPNGQDARTMWYHDHGVHHTAQNAYMGLAGQYHLSDAVEDALAIPKGRYDVPLIIKDVLFDTDGQLLYDDRSESGLMGHVITVNGKPWPAMRVEQRKYRFRVLNASLSRSYELSLSTNDPITEGETVRMVARFGPHQGRYMIHCHNLVHEDHDMMVQFQVGTGGPDPITATPAKALPAPPL